MRIENSNGRGQSFLPYLMMVRDNNIQTNFVCQSHLLHTSDAAISGDHQACAAFTDFADRVRIKPIAFRPAFGQISLDRTIQVAEKMREKSGRGNTIDIVVTKNSDRLFLLQRLNHPFHRLTHICH